MALYFVSSKMHTRLVLVPGATARSSRLPWSPGRGTPR
uniref:Uncharacterized protein n=1 Tax=Arundo donax TaxID=35708 RepID=A0A0A9AD27_ARUDO